MQLIHKVELDVLGFIEVDYNDPLTLCNIKKYDKFYERQFVYVRDENKEEFVVIYLPVWQTGRGAIFLECLIQC